jgi:LysM repeat protein
MHALPPPVVTVRPGDTLAAIAGRACGDPGDYWALAYNNSVPNPDLIYAGQVFKVACQAAAAAIADRYGLAGNAPASPQASSPVHYVSHPSAAPARSYRHSSGAVVTSVSGTYQGSDSVQRCIIARESGGNSQVVNATGHYGLYQFSAETWAAHGGNPADFGHASVAEQNQVFASTVAQDGYSDWQPYDGC